MPVTCHKCNTLNRDGANFCKNCAVSLSAKSETPVPPPVPSPAPASVPPAPARLPEPPRPDLPRLMVKGPELRPGGVAPSNLPTTGAREGRSGVLAVILSLVIPGLGHFYLGQIGKGIMFLILQLLGVGLVTSIVGLLLGVPILIVNPIWAAIDAYKAATPRVG